MTRKRWRHSIKLIPVYLGKTTASKESLRLTAPEDLLPPTVTLTTLLQESVVDETQSNPSRPRSPTSGIMTPDSDNATVHDKMSSDTPLCLDSFLPNQSLGLVDSDMALAEYMIHRQHERRRSEEPVESNNCDIREPRERRRSKTSPLMDQKETALLFKAFESEQVLRRSESFSKEFSKCLDSERMRSCRNDSGMQLDTPTLKNPGLTSVEADGLMTNLKGFMEEAERYSKFAIGAYGTNFMKIMGYAFSLARS